MKFPNFNEEKKLCRKGYRFAVGLDEAGRGPLAGPVVAGAVAFRNFKFPILKQVKDSKKLSFEKRERAYKMIVSCSDIMWGVGIVSEKIIDKINILEATKLAMKKAVDNLIKHKYCHKLGDRLIYGNTCFLLIDGNFGLNINLPQKSIIKADEKVFSVATASIIAKVTRDRLMQKYHKKYPQYGFNQHKGYGTKEHFANLEKFGPCKIHRKSFYPVSSFFKINRPSTS